MGLKYLVYCLKEYMLDYLYFCSTAITGDYPYLYYLVVQICMCREFCWNKLNSFFFLLLNSFITTCLCCMFATGALHCVRTF